MPPNAALLLDILGWLGAATLLAAYAMVSTRRWAGDSVPYQLFNLGGSVLLMANTLYYGAYPSAFVNVFWIGIALFTLRKPLAARLAGKA